MNKKIIDIGLLENPDLKPQGKNTNPSLISLFNNRNYYSNYVIPFLNQEVPNSPLYANLLNTNYYYGLVDNNLNIVYRKENKQFMKKVPSGDEKNKFVFDFVADAFNDMNEYLYKTATINKLSKSSVYFNLRCYNNPTNLDQYLTSIQNYLSDLFIQYLSANDDKNSQVKDVKSFSSQFILFLNKKIKENMSVTKSGNIVQSNFYFPFNGLTIDISNEDAGDDLNKFDKFLNDPGFAIFSDACKRYGFFIDGRIPWRLMADLSSPAMRENFGKYEGYMLRYNIFNTNYLFSTRFEIAAYDEIKYLNNLFFNTYKKLTDLYPYSYKDDKELKQCDLKKQLFIKRQTITKEQFDSIFLNTYWSRVYAYLRNYEEQRNLQQQQFENIVREANNFIKIGRIKEGMIYLNSYFKQFKGVSNFSSLQETKLIVQNTSKSSTMNELVF